MCFKTCSLFAQLLKRAHQLAVFMGETNAFGCLINLETFFLRDTRNVLVEIVLQKLIYSSKFDLTQRECVIAGPFYLLV